MRGATDRAQISRHRRAYGEIATLTLIALANIDAAMLKCKRIDASGRQQNRR
jgi:hypothetical protein